MYIICMMYTNAAENKKIPKDTAFFFFWSIFWKKYERKDDYPNKKNVSLVYSFLHVIIFFTSEKINPSMLGDDIKS